MDGSLIPTICPEKRVDTVQLVRQALDLLMQDDMRCFDREVDSLKLKQMLSEEDTDRFESETLVGPENKTIRPQSALVQSSTSLLPEDRKLTHATESIHEIDKEPATLTSVSTTRTESSEDDFLEIRSVSDRSQRSGSPGEMHTTGTEAVPLEAASVAFVAPASKCSSRKQGVISSNTVGRASEDEREEKDDPSLDRRPVLDKVIRPNPVKSTPPPQGASRHAAQQGRKLETDASLEPALPQQGSCFAKSPVLRDTSGLRANSSSSESKQQEEAEGDRKQPWCKETRDLARQQNREIQKKKEANELRRDELQCNFAELPGYSTMAPTNLGRVNNEQYDRHENTAQLNNNRVAGHSAHRVVRSSTEDEDAQGLRPTPLFERLVSEEVQEVKTYVRIIEVQDKKLQELEKVEKDLEKRLQSESKGRQQLEATLESREREWARQLEHLENDRNEWRNSVQAERNKNTRLMEEVMRKEQEIRRMLQRKYDNEGGRSVRGVRGHQEKNDKYSGTHSASRSPELRSSEFQSPHQFLQASGSAEVARLRNTKGLLLDFFGI